MSTVTAPASATLIATALCDRRDLEIHRDPQTCHTFAGDHHQASGHRVMVIETTVTMYEAVPDG